MDQNLKPTPLKNASSTIGEVIYNSKTLTLTIEFKNGGRYAYHPVSFFTFTALVTAPSPGSFLSKEIIKNPEIKATKL